VAHHRLFIRQMVKLLDCCPSPNGRRSGFMIPGHIYEFWVAYTIWWHRQTPTANYCHISYSWPTWLLLRWPSYLELCRRGGLRSATTSNLVIPRCRLSTYSTRAFSVAGPVCWNSLPDYLKSFDLSFNCFRKQLKHFYFVNIDTSPSATLAH